MFGILIKGPANVFCNNHGIVKNVSIPESTLMKKHNAINYHAVQEAVAAGIPRVGKEDSEMNLADLLTKVLTGEKMMEHLLAYHVVKIWKYDAKVQLPVTSVHGVYLLSQLRLMA